MRLDDKSELLRPILLPHVEVRQVEPDIYTTSLVPNTAQGYDKISTLYNLVVSNPLYNRLLWGNWPRDYRHFAQQAIMASSGSPCLDAGCGSLIFTAEVYRAYQQGLLIVLDSSIEMLRVARQKLEPVPANVILLVGDIFNLPFENDAFGTVMSFGMLHLFDDVQGMVNELLRVSSRGGHSYLTSLVTDRGLGAKYLALLQRAGEVARPKSSQEIQQLLGSGWSSHVKGNMAYLTGQKA